MVVKVNASVNHLISLGNSGRLVSISALCIEDGEEIFCHGVVIRIPHLDMEGVITCCFGLV